ncbi:hypothetical protein COX00_00150, partial [Candidatus Uhrbacteria bacterium CG22_combo_CG10-13_8_21_14_all_47_17]
TLLIWISFAHDLPRPTDGTLARIIRHYYGTFYEFCQSIQELSEGKKLFSKPFSVKHTKTKLSLEKKSF